MNKFLITVLALLALTGSAQSIRYVNGIRVDVGPVLSWYSLGIVEQRKTPRPMQHWKRISILDIKGSVGTWNDCVCTNDEGDSVEILVDNLPTELRDSIVRLKDLDGKIASLRKSTTQEKKLIATAEGRLANTAQKNLTTDSSDLEELSNERAELEQKLYALRRSVLLAMFTGRKYGGLEIWDCGRRQ